MERDVLRKIQAQQQQKTTPDVEARDNAKPFDLRTAGPLELQSMIGNKATSQLLGGGGSGPVVQTKMTVTDANDAHEQEADKVAEQIVSGGGEAQSVQKMGEDDMQAKRLQRFMPDAPEEVPSDAPEEVPDAAPDVAPEEQLAAKRIQRMGDAGAVMDDASISDDDLAMAKRIQREGMEELPEAEEATEGAESELEEADMAQAKRIQREAMDMSKSFDVGGQVEDQIKNTSGGQALDGGIQAKMEQGTGHDFSNVRVHTDSNADALSESLGARAFTTGSDIFFKQGEYNPNSDEGQKLIAHEGTHVIQQGGTQLKREDD